MLEIEGTVSLLLVGRTTLLCEALGVALAFSEHPLVLHPSELQRRTTVPSAEVVLCEITSAADLATVEPLPAVGARVALMTRPSPELVDAAIKQGFSGIVTPFCSLKDLHRCIRQARAGDVYFDEAIQRCLSSVMRGEPTARLSPREREVAIMVAQGYTSRAIGTSLRLSAKTISNHRRNIFRKLGMRDAVSLTRYVIDAGWISGEELPSRPPDSVIGTESEDWPQAKELRRG